MTDENNSTPTKPTIEELSDRLNELETKVYEGGKERKILFRKLKKAIAFSSLIAMAFACGLGSKELKDHDVIKLGDYLDSLSVFFLTTALITVFPKLGTQLNKLLSTHLKGLASSDSDDKDDD